MNFIERLVAKRIVKRIAKGIEMAGWKTKTAGIAAILSGGGTAINSIVNGDFSGAWEGWLLLVAPACRGFDVYKQPETWQNGDRKGCNRKARLVV